jgi:hypothetical protein
MQLLGYSESPSAIVTQYFNLGKLQFCKYRLRRFSKVFILFDLRKVSKALASLAKWNFVQVSLASSGNDL